MKMSLNYQDYHATFKNNILNIYNSRNKLLTSKAYSQIIYLEQIEHIFKKIIDMKYKKAI